MFLRYSLSPTQWDWHRTGKCFVNIQWTDALKRQRVKSDTFFPGDTSQWKKWRGWNASLTLLWHMSSSSAPGFYPGHHNLSCLPRIEENCLKDTMLFKVPATCTVEGEGNTKFITTGCFILHERQWERRSNVFSSSDPLCGVTSVKTLFIHVAVSHFS